MTFCNPVTMLLSAAVLLLAATVEVRAFVVGHPVLRTSGCGGTSFARQAAATCTDSSGVSMNAPANGELSRGAWAGRVLGVAFSGVAALAQGPGLASAELGVGEGGLPDGARQFSNFVKLQKDWAALGATVKSRGAEVSAEEWKNVSLFLRKAYQLGGDLEFLSGTFPSDKKKTAVALVRAIQKEVQAADEPARAKNAEAFLVAQSSVEKKLADFMELFNDVPAEL